MREPFFCRPGELLTFAFSRDIRDENSRNLQRLNSLSASHLVDVNFLTGLTPESFFTALNFSYSSEATEATLAMFVDDELTQSSVVLSSSSLRGFDNAGNEIGEMDQVDLLSVQQEAMTLQEEIEHCLKKKKELYSKAREVKDPRVKQFYVLEAQNFDRRAKEYSANANKRLADANTAENFVDLHFMDVSSALKLLKNKLTIIDRPENMRNGRSGRKMIVVTGYGKSANGYCKLKRAVLQWLKQCGYEYHLSANQGEIVVEAK
ncbi:unnamed protein product [Toxocara canis]|uniref:Smr domain-containing protein n=1 Tax=Toxocara canis TaxID=6265 RepID=A0A183UFT2_TOXCA|nr:unnamed protein product [Toxocara canis]